MSVWLPVQWLMDIIVFFLIIILSFWLLANLRFSSIYYAIKRWFFWTFATKRMKYIRRYNYYLAHQRWHLHPIRVKDAALEVRYRRWCQIVGYKHQIFHNPILWWFAHIDLDMIEKMSDYYYRQIDLWARNIITFSWMPNGRAEELYMKIVDEERL